MAATCTDPTADLVARRPPESTRPDDAAAVELRNTDTVKIVQTKCTIVSEGSSSGRGLGRHRDISQTTSVVVQRLIS